MIRLGLFTWYMIICFAYNTTRDQSFCQYYTGL